MVYISYFSGYKGNNGVAITLGANWWAGETYKALAPSAELLEWYKYNQKKKTKEFLEAVYEECYRNETLRKLDAEKVYNDLDGKVLLCFEKPGDFCHRHIVAAWLREHGFDCEELKL